MRLLFDQNLSRKLPNKLSDVFLNSSHIQFHNLAEADDNNIWEFAKTQNFCIVTQDVDFAEKSRLYGSPPKVIWLRCGNKSTKEVEALLRSGEQTINRFLKDSNLHCLQLF